MFRKKYRSHKGFSLVETGVVLLVTGMSMLAAGQFVNIYSQNAKHKKTIENMEMSFAALKEYAGLSGAYPCPADPSLAPSDPLYGRGQCRNESSGSFSPDSCAGTPAGITCTTHGSRDVDSNGSNDVVLIGALPFKDLIDGTSDTPFRSYHKTDGYGGLIAYAVTEKLTETYSGNNLADPFDPLEGAISVLDENLVDLMDPPDEGQFVIVSYGRDGVGAYSAQGKLVESCTVPSLTLPPPAVQPPTQGLYSGNGKIQTENCDNNDAHFIKGIFAFGDNNSYFDDYVYYKGRGLTSLWKRSLFSPPGESYIYNTNLGNVGVETPTPAKKLHVMGDIGAQGETRSPEYCDPAETYCLDPDFLGGDIGADAECADDEVAYAIGSNRIYCKKVEWTVPVKTCTDINGHPAFIRGFSNLGNLWCCNRAGDCQTQ